MLEGDMTDSDYGLLPHLRTATRDAHRQLEQHPLLQPLLSPALSLAHYARVISAFTGFYAALEPPLQRALAFLDTPGYRYRPRLPLLQEDRTVLPARAVSPCTAAPVPTCEEEAMGILYVLEGATQGGRVIAPRLRTSLGLNDGTGARYFHLYRHRSWEIFCALPGVRRTGPRGDAAPAMARATFESLHRHLDFCLSHNEDLCGGSHDGR